MNSRLTIVGGAYGSGKTEFAIAYALTIKKEAEFTSLIDLDIVNPYFRSRDLRAELEKQGITVISTEPGLEYSDLPALSPRIYGALQDQKYQVVFDVGGDPVGAKALGRFNQYFGKEKYNFWVVVNPFRPDTRNLSETVELISGLETASRLKATGLIANINLGRETNLEIWQDGLKLFNEVAQQTNIPVIYHMVEMGFFLDNKDFFSDYQVFPVELKLLAPWLRQD